MSVDRLINLLAAITLFEMMISIGLGVDLSAALSVLKDLRLVWRVLVANYLLVPLTAVMLLIFFHPAPLASAGFLVAAVCPGAPYGPPFTSIAKGNVTVAVGLMVLLAGSSALIAPLLLVILLPYLTGSGSLRIDFVKIVSALLGTQLFPLIVGLMIRKRRPAVAERLQRPARMLSLSLNLIILGAVLFFQGRMLLQIHLRGYLGMSCLLLMSMALGWSVRRRGEDGRGLVIATSVRNVGVALVIVSASFPGTPAIVSATAYALFQTIVVAMIALALGRFTATPVAAKQRAA